MAGLFGGHHGGGKPKPVAAPTPTPTPANANGAIAGVSQNYGSNNMLSNQAQIARGSFLGS
jgi:hypothetical protein